MASWQRENCCFYKSKWRATLYQLNALLTNLFKKQANKNTLGKTMRDLALLKEFLKAKQVDKDVENIEPSELNELVSAFLVEVKKKDGDECGLTILRSFILSIFLLCCEYSSSMCISVSFP
jgi:site-specific recombinase XerD